MDIQENEDLSSEQNESGDGKLNLNACSRKDYEYLAHAVLYLTPQYSTFPKEELDEDRYVEVKQFYLENKRKFYNRKCTKRPIYTLKVEGNVINYDQNGVPIIMINTYVKQELAECKQLLYREVVEDVLNELHVLPVTKGKTTCLPGGINGLSKLFTSKYHFKGSFNFIKSFLSSCVNCRVNTPLPSTCKPPPIPIRTFKPHDRLQCDLIDMAPKKYRSFMANNKWGYRYILTVKCCFSKFCWLFPIKTKSASEVYKILRLLFIKEGAPKILQSDNGSEFIAGIIKKLSQEFRINLIHGRPYHPQSQGQVENLNKQVKKCLARFLQKVRSDQQANLWPILLSGTSDFLNMKWHSTINDIPFRIYRNREPSTQTTHVVPDDEFLVSSLEEPSLSDFEFGEEDLMPEFDSSCPDDTLFQNIISEVNDLSSDIILASSFGTIPAVAVNLLQSVVDHDACSSPEFKDESLECFESSDISQFLGYNSSEYKVLLCDVLESTEHTIQRNIKRSRCASLFNVGDKVVYQVQEGDNRRLKRKDPFNMLNEIGVVEEVLPGGMYKVYGEEKDGSVFVKCVFGGQMLKVSPELGDESPVHMSSSKYSQLSLLSLHNSISKYASTVRGEMYDQNLRRRPGKQSSITMDNMFKKYHSLLDFGFLAMLSSVMSKSDEASHFQSLFTSGMKELQKDGFHYFLYGTIHWERERKKKLSGQITDNLSTICHKSSCLDCLKGDKEEPCYHPCCQETALQLAIKSGVVTEDGNGVLSLSSTHKTTAQSSADKPGNTVPLSSSTATRSADKPGNTVPLSSSTATRSAAKPGNTVPLSSSTATRSAAKPENIVPLSSSTATRSAAESGNPVPLSSSTATRSAAESGNPVPLSSSTATRSAAKPGNTVPLSSSTATRSAAKPGNTVPLPSSSKETEPALFSSHNQNEKYEEMKKRCLWKITAQHEFLEFSEPLDIAFSDSDPKDDTVFQNMKYLENIVSNHGALDVHEQVKVKSCDGIWMQVQGYSSFCGLCALNNALCLPLGSLPVFSIQDLDLAADIVWLKQVTVTSTLSMLLEPTRSLNGDYSIMAMEQAASMKNVAFQRLDSAVRALTDGVNIAGLNNEEFGELYKLFLHMFDGCDKPSLVIRMKRHHFVTLIFNEDRVVFLDSCRSVPIHMSPLQGMLFLQRESQNNPLFAAVNIERSGTKHNPLVADEFPDTQTAKDFQSSLEEIWRDDSLVCNDTIISERHGNITAKDVRSLKPDCLVNDKVIYYIGRFLMSENQDLFVASTFWMLGGIQELLKELKACSLHHIRKFIFPIHCPGHWWCVMIDTASKTYGEYDSFCRDRSSPYIFNLLNTVFSEVGIHLQSCSPVSLATNETVQINFIEDEDIEYELYDLLRPPQDATEDIESLEAMYPESMQSCFFVGLTGDTNRYLYERPKKTFHKGNYHALLPLNEMNNIDSWRKAHHGKTRGRFHFYQWNRAFDMWLENEPEKKNELIARRDINGWLQLDLKETFQYQHWCQNTWETIKSKYKQ